MATQASSAASGLRAVRLNYRECYPALSPRHPASVAAPPSDALAILWLEGIGAASANPRFAYLNYNRALHLYRELHVILAQADGRVGERNAAARRGELGNHPPRLEPIDGQVSGG